MRRKLPIFYSALLLTGVNLLLRLVGTSFQVYLSATLGAAGIGLLQLTLSVGNLAMVAGMAGIRTATMYLSAEELGKKRPQNITWVLSGCILYSILCSGSVAVLLYALAPQIANVWIGDLRTLGALRLFAAFLPVVCVCGLFTGYFTAANRIGTLVAVEIVEQLASMAITMGALTLWAKDNPGRACMSVVLGSSLGACLTASCLIVLRLREHAPTGPRLSVRQRLISTAVPLALADLLKSSISTTENLMVPRRLGLNPKVSDPLAAFGLLSGMVFPILMFPACILFGLAELLIPELARCAAAQSGNRIQYLVRRSLKAAMLYGVLFSGAMFLLADPLCMALYHSSAAGAALKGYALMIPFLYCDAITDAMTKGLGQQKACVRYNILTSAMDVALLFVLLPRYGMQGYYISFLVTHLLNFLLSLRRLLRISGVQLPSSKPILAGIAGILAVWGACFVPAPLLRCLAYLALLASLLTLLQVIGMEDIHWLRGLIQGNLSKSASEKS